MFYVYRFLDRKKNIIYVGKSKQVLEQRFRGHLHLPDACYDLTYKIEYIECSTESDMSIKEIYYINKFRHDGSFFNVLDIADAPKSVEFNDKWKQYRGPLGAQFHNSINYAKGYTTQKEVRYNKDGTIDKRKPNKKKGVESSVEGLTEREVNLIIDHMINEINCAANSNQEQICFRNLLMFILSINLPIKPREFLSIKYRDLFTADNCPKAFAMQLGRFHKDEVINLPLRNIVRDVLTAYAEKYGLTYLNHANESLFQSRKHQVISLISWGRILRVATEAVGIQKNIGTESIRKTYGLNIYNRSVDKLNAILFLGEIWDQIRDTSIIKYLNLTNEIVDFDYYLGEAFSLGNVDLSKIECLQSRTPIVLPSKKTEETSQTERVFDEQMMPKTEPVQKTVKEAKTNRVWSKEKKLEIVLQYLDHHIPQKDLAKQYGVNIANIGRWVSEYRKYGEVVFEDKK